MSISPEVTHIIMNGKRVNVGTCTGIPKSSKAKLQVVLKDSASISSVN